MKIKSTDPHVDLRHLQRIAEDIDTLLQMEHIFGDDWFMDDDFEVTLVEIKQV